MNDTSLKESVSALVDGESNDMDLQRVLNAVSDDSSSREELRESWQRYQTIGSVMRGDYQHTKSLDISESLRLALEEEKVIENKPSSHFWKNLTGKTAIAATVAFAVVLGVQQYSGVSDAPAGTESVAGVKSGAVVPQGFDQPNVNTQTVSASQNRIDGSFNAKPLSGYSASELNNEELMRERLDQLLLLHAKKSSESSSLGVLPYARTNQLEDSQ